MKILSATLEAQEAKIHEGLNPLNQVNENFNNLAKAIKNGNRILS